MIEDFDGLLHHLGIGKWSYFAFALCCYRALLAPGVWLSGSFIHPSTEHTCHLPPQGILNDSDACTYLVHNGETGVLESEPCSSWDWDNSTWTSTLNSEFDLACDSRHMGATFSSLFMTGMGVGGVINGALCEIYGRKNMFVIGLLIFYINLIIQWLPDINSILAARFISGIGQSMTSDSLLILTLEIVEPKYRPIVAICVWVPWVFGCVILGGVGYLVRDWRNLHMSVALPYLLFLPAIWFLDESPRWLIVRGRREQAQKILSKAANMQGVSLPPKNEIQAVMDDTARKSNIAEGSSKPSMMKSVKIFMGRFCLLFSTRRMLVLTLVTCYTHLTMSLLYFGLALNGVSYSDDPFLYMVFSGLVDLPSVTIAAPIVMRWGRSTPGIICFFGCGVPMLAMPFVPAGMLWLKTSLALLAKAMVSMAWSVIYLQVNELFPTEVRLLGMGIGAIFTTGGSSLSAYISDILTPLAAWAPSVVFGLSSVLAAFAAALLPETKGISMPDTVQDLENLGKNKGNKSNTTNQNGEIEAEKLPLRDGV